MVKTASTQSYPCPAACGCGRIFKGLKTLSNHFDLCHPREQKPVWIVDNWVRSLGRKPKVKSTAVKEDTAAATQVSITSPEPSTLPIPEGLLSRMFLKLKDVAESGQQVFKLQKVSSLDSADTQESFTNVHINEAADIDIDEDLVECCKTLNDGGFVRAFHRFNDASKFQVIHTNGQHVTAFNGMMMATMTIPEVQRRMADVWGELCDAWFDFKRSIHFDGTEFDDEADWEDVCDDIVNADTIKAFAPKTT
jgi:hypothetical protein